MNDKLNIRFAFFSCALYLLYGVLYNYAAFYMQEKGADNTHVGIVMAAASAVCILLQSGMGRFLDTFKRFSSWHVFMLFSIILTVSVAGLCVTGSLTAILFFFFIILIILMTDSSLLNTFGMEYVNQGLDLNLPLSRGLASVSSAGMTLIMGHIITRTSADSIPMAFFAGQALTFFALFLLKPAPQERSVRPSGEKHEKSSSVWQPGLLTLLIGMLLCYLSYTAITVFQVNIIESVGGGSRELGISVAIACIVELPIMAAFIPLSKRFSYASLLRLSCIFFLVRAVLMMFASSVYAVYALQTLTMMSHGLFIPASAYYINSITDDSAKATAQALIGIFSFGLSGLISNLVSGIILDYFSVKTMLALMSALAAIGLVMVCRQLSGGRKQ